MILLVFTFSVKAPIVRVALTLAVTMDLNNMPDLQYKVIHVVLKSKTDKLKSLFKLYRHNLFTAHL